MQHLKLQRSDEVSAVVVVSEAAVEVVAVAEAVVVTTTKHKARGSRSIKGPNTQTYHLETGSGARCISGGGSPPFSVPNRPHAHGKMCMPRNLKTKTNETGTSPVQRVL